MDNLNFKSLGDMAKMLLIMGGNNVPAPGPLIEKRAAKKLSSTALDAWIDVKIALSRLSNKEQTEIAKLIIHSNNPIINIIEKVRHDIVEETRETFTYVEENPEYKKVPSFEEFHSMMEGED